MAHQDALSEWTVWVSSQFPTLSRPQATVLAWWSFGIALTRTCGRRTVATFLALLLDRQVDTVEQRLYEWCVEAAHKAGRQRHTLDVTTCFIPLLRAIVRLWHGTQLPLAIDATTLGTRFVVLVVTVVYRGIGIPVAWAVMPARQSGTWRPVWLRLLRRLRPAIPPTWTVVVLADRGLYAAWLFRRIVRLGWHPFLRINTAAHFRPAGQARWVTLRSLVPQDGHAWVGAGTCFKGRANHLTCTLMAWWNGVAADPWFVLTDLAPPATDVAWYGLRTWCEQGFKCLKRGGWQWQHTQMTDPDRAARLWLALALAMLWMVTVGTELDVSAVEDSALPDLRALLAPRRAGVRRVLRLFRLGWIGLLVQVLRRRPIPLPRQLVPESWPRGPAIQTAPLPP